MMPLTKKGKKIMSSMKEQYGSKRGEQVFYASKNKGLIGGVERKGYQEGDRVSPASYEGQQQEVEKQQRQKEWAAQQLAEQKQAVFDYLRGKNFSKEQRATLAAAFKGVEYAKIAAEDGGKAARKAAKRDGIDLSLGAFNDFVNNSVNIVKGLSAELQQMPDLKRYGKTTVSPVLRYQYEGEQGGFGAEYNPLYKSGRVSGGMKLGPGTLSGEAAVDPYQKRVGVRYTTRFSKGGKVYNKRGQPRKVQY